MTVKQLTAQDLEKASINQMLMEYNLNLHEIFSYSKYTPKTAYPEVVAGYYTMRSLLTVANRFGDVEEANFFANKIMEVDDDWYEITKGSMPLDTVETDNPAVFQKAIAILETM
jgi:hypothetical protein